MEDYEVRDVMFRQQTPDIRVEFSCSKSPTKTVEFDCQSAK